MKKVKEVYNHWLPPRLGAAAVTIGYTIYYAESFDYVPKNLRRHEFKHIEQIDNLGIFWFYHNYFLQYILGRLQGLNHWDAYEKITFEVEARAAAKVISSPWEGRI